jgi:DNA processing protein
MGNSFETSSTEDRLAWLRLIRSDRIGPVAFYQLVERFGSADAALEALPDLARKSGNRRFRLCSVDTAMAEIEASERVGARMIAAFEDCYPKLLAALDHPPPIIHVIGDDDIFVRPAVAMVGARNASALGRRFATELARDLGSLGVVVVSGLARGIDTATHEGAIDTGTVAVLAGGVDQIWPPQNEGLYRRIAESGAIVSERPPGYTAKARDFPRRNRLISGLSLGTLVVEAAVRSGSLITARHALEQGREVFAVPGSPLDPRCRGCNMLIRDGAVLTESAEDVIQAIGPMVPILQPAPLPRKAAMPDAESDPTVNGRNDEPDAESRRLVDQLLGPSPVEIDELIRQAELTPAVVATILLELELAGRLQRHAGNKVSVS